MTLDHPESLLQKPPSSVVEDEMRNFSPIENSEKDSNTHENTANKLSECLHYSDESSQISLPPAFIPKLERHDSCESVGSMEDEEDCHSNSSGRDYCDCDLHDRDDESHSSHGQEPRNCERSTSVASDASEEGGRDSGIEAEKEPDMVVPDNDTMEKIVSQVEFYFSDANVVKDKFLLKHIRRNKEGYVSLKLVSSFKKVKQLTKDWRVVAYSLRKKSVQIQINDQGSKIRRVQPLPEIDDSPVTCAVLALNIPLEKPTIDSVSQLFSENGDIAFIRILKAGGNLPSDVKSYLTKYPDLGEKHCAWIEYESPDSAKLATNMSTEEGMKVVLIVPESQKKQEKQKQQPNSQSSSRRNSFNNKNNAHNNFTIKPGNRKNSFTRSRNDSGVDMEYARRPLMQRRKAVSLPSSQLPIISEMNSREHRKGLRPKSKSCVEFTAHAAPSTNWVQRHLLAAAAASAASAAAPVASGSRPSHARALRLSSGSLPLPDGVVRFPKGPDGSRGFGRIKHQTYRTEGVAAH